MAEAATAPLAGGRQQRRLRNYLLDSHFQLKYSAYLVLIAVVISACLGVFLWRTSREVLAQSQKTVERGYQFRIDALGGCQVHLSAPFCCQACATTSHAPVWPCGDRHRPSRDAVSNLVPAA